MRTVVLGLGVQGYKRRKYAGDDFVASIDPFNSEADFRDIRDVPVDSYDAVLACIPDEPKVDLLRFCLANKKHVLVEKPLWAIGDNEISELEALAVENNVVCYTAYNHRFEPHFIRMQNLIASGDLGRIYSCKMFYGNGTAKLVRESEWRDKGAGVLPDLGSHLLDTCRFWFGTKLNSFSLGSFHTFENQAPDHVVIESENTEPRVSLEMTLCMWRNHFTCDILAERGSAHIESLCKWGPSTFTHRERILPSGRPHECSETLVQEDPTWKAEYLHFKRLIETSTQTDLSTDIWLQKNLRSMGEIIIRS
ncbi:Gfo/Idh/MocA family oxidoreductase [Daejeonella sp.]|uniref:Gfo/Idh/MocA family protein n=1 Tax=Daejeonella sp. TaxID=2805397 RepID=UPI0030BFC9C6